jgi:hypothetical protein
VTASARPAAAVQRPLMALSGYALLGVAFGFVLIRSEVASWFRIQEMFRLESPRMYLIIGSALVTAALSLAVLRHAGARAANGELIAVPPKELGRGYRYWIGGSLFGVGWALTGACPGPMFARLGAGTFTMIPVIAAAITGAWLYGWARPRLPH